MSTVGSKKFLYRFCIFYMMSLLSYQSVFAQMEACRFSDSEIEGVEVGQIGDRKIYTLFTTHLYNEPDTVFVITNFYRPTNAVVLLNQLIERNQERIASERSDVQKITELAESGQVDWIGIENFKTNTSAAFTYLENRTRLNKTFNHLPEWDPSKTDQLLLLVFHADTIAYATHPEVFRGIRKYPLEDESLMIETSHLTISAANWDRAIKRNNHMTDAQLLEMRSFIEQSMVSNFRLVTKSEFEDLLDRIEVPKEARIHIRRFRRIHNEIISIALKRDEVIVQSILDIPGNGLILFGTTHGPGIKQGLTTACQNRHNLP